MHIDHIQPVVETSVGFVDWNTYISRLFCSSNNLQLLCPLCHKNKTLVEQQERKAAKTGQYAIGRKLSVEIKNKISESHKGKTPKNLQDIQEERKRSVIGTNCFTGEIVEFESLTEAAKTINGSSGNIATVCNGTTKRKKVKGWSFKYKE